ncbi:MAG: type IX secretion system protein PorQ [Bacteroidales bacterium]|jgi:hypothetical protein|nr:type IX secretion system protein PorQ [Bacteroidales bacterium]HOL98701.1 type IX secretion system protein PorQ [Bacteroidales bacterium]HOM36991.1 type IX secretion system protein PorQ [Bacteroidales bacterium]HPD24586.1 type IX secretion system protein PorQ [Bacteroidales bacterium]HRT00390.1 type IX secretion system protein PorQ [Bacteroidales bacterium]
MSRLIIIYFFSAISLLALSQSGGRNTYEFLNLPNSPYIASLGGTNVSHYQKDPVLVNSNPALLRPAFDEKLSLNYINYLSDINFGYISYSKNIENIGMFGVGMQYINYGKFINADETGEILGNFYAAEYSFNMFYSYPLSERLNAGASFKTIYSSFWQYFSSGLALDLGLAYVDTSNMLSAGLVIKNAGFQLKPYVKGNREPLPFDIQIGVTKKFRHAPLRFSVTAKDLTRWNLSYKSVFSQNYNLLQEEDPSEKFIDKIGKIGDEFIRHIVIGFEIVPSDAFYFSFGYNYRRRTEMVIPTAPKLTGFSAGFGLNLSKFSISYGIASYHLAGVSNHLSLCLNLNQIYKRV